MSKSKKESAYAFAGLLALGLLLLGRKLFSPEELFFQAVRDPNPWLVFYPWRDFIRRSFFGGEFPLWNPYNGLGEPFLANYQSGVFSILRWPFYFLPFKAAAVAFILFELVFAGFGAWLLARRLKLSRPGSFLCGGGFMLCGYLVQYLNNWHIVIDLLIPYGLLASERLLAKSSRKNLTLMVLVFSLILLGGQPTAAICTLGFVSLYFFYRAVGRKRLIALPLFLLAFVFSLEISLIQLLPFLEAIPQSWAYHPPGYAYQHLEIKTFASMMAPLIFGRGPETPFPIQQIMPWLGTAVVVFGLSAIFNLRKLRREAAFFAALLALGLGIIYGLPGFSLLARIPGISRLTLWRYLQPVISLCAIMLAGVGLEKILKARLVSLPALMLSLLIIISGFLYSLISFPTLRPWSLYGFLISLLVLVLACFLPKLKRGSGWALVFAALIEPIVWHHLVDKPGFWVNLEKRDLSNFVSLAGEKPLTRLAAEPKVWIPDQMLLLPVHDLGINDALIPSRYVRLARHLNQYADDEELLQDFFAYHSLRLKESAFQDDLSRLLSAGYFIRKRSQASSAGCAVLDAGNYSKERYSHTALYGDPVCVLRIEDSVHRFFFPRTLYRGESGEDSFGKILEMEDLENQAVIEGLPLAVADKNFGQAEAKELDLGAGKIDFAYTSSGDAFVIFSEQYFPGWRAYLDGKETRIFPADFLLRGIFIDAGEHKLSMVYQPDGFRLGLYASLAALAGLIIFTLGSSAARAKPERSRSLSGFRSHRPYRCFFLRVRKIS